MGQARFFRALNIVQRGRNREACFFAEEDSLAYRYWIGEALRETGCRLRRNSSLAPSFPSFSEIEAQTAALLALSTPPERPA